MHLPILPLFHGQRATAARPAFLCLSLPCPDFFAAACGAAWSQRLCRRAVPEGPRPSRAQCSAGAHPFRSSPRPAAVHYTCSVCLCCLFISMRLLVSGCPTGVGWGVGNASPACVVELSSRVRVDLGMEDWHEEVGGVVLLTGLCWHLTGVDAKKSGEHQGT